MRFIAWGLGGLVVLVDVQRCNQSEVLRWLALGDIVEAVAPARVRPCLPD